MAKKNTVKILEDYTFELVGLYTHQKDYQIIWAINNALSFNLKKCSDFNFVLGREKQPLPFSLYNWEDNESKVSVVLLSNISLGIRLIREVRAANYLLFFVGGMAHFYYSEIVHDLKKIPQILTLIPIDEKAIDKAQAILPDIEIHLLQESLSSSKKQINKKLKHGRK